MVTSVAIIHAQSNYNFAAVTSSGHTLYYAYIINMNTHDTSLQVVSPLVNDWWPAATRPVGNLVIDSVVYRYPVVSIGRMALGGCSGLTSVTIPNSIISVDGTAFDGCTGLITPVYNLTCFARFPVSYEGAYSIPNGIVNICDRAFANCGGLTSINMPSTVTSIGSYSFFYCSGLVSLTLGSGLVSIGGSAFYGCTNIASIQIRCYPPAISSNTFNAVPVNIPITVPCGLLSNYQNAPNWSNFTHFVEGCVTITAMTSDATKGIAIGGGSYSIGDTVTLEAIPFDNAHFIRWSNNSTDNPISFTAQQNATYVAIFGAGSSANDTVYIHDTTIINNYIHDTTLIALHDTTYINNYIHDTTWITVHVHDTTIVNHYIHDTTYITLHDTITNTIHDTTIVNNYIHDTTYITLHDTISNTVHDTINTIIHDTVTNTVHDTIDNYVYDTTWVYDTTILTDTLWLTDTVFLYDTVIVHDTVFITGVENAEPLDAKIYAHNGHIVVEGANGYTITLYDAVGRQLATKETLPSGEPCELGVAATGVYLVKVGPYPARRIVVKR